MAVAVAAESAGVMNGDLIALATRSTERPVTAR
jgi:hypothetical protein